MRKQIKLVAVLSAAALLTIGASMTSFAATGWAEENGSWVYYDRDGSRVSDEWKKSGNNWFYLDDDGSMTTDALIEDDDNYFYVGADGAMVTNQWVAVENEDAGDDDEPENYWFYFQANGKAYKAGNADNASFRTINGKKYVFDDEGRMQFGWVNESGERQTGDDAWQEGVYYCGDENDGAQAIGWREIHILDEDWDPDSQINGDLFDEDQDRWFYFKTNGKRYADEEKTINGRKYNFDSEGRMIAEWFTKGTPTKSEGALNYGSPSSVGETTGTVTGSGQGSTAYSKEWKYYGSPEDGARVTKGWFQVVASEWLNADDYDDSDDAWYYSDGDGKLVTSEFKTINGKKYAFDSFGRMVDGLKIIQLEAGKKNDIKEIFKKDNYDDEDKFEDFYNDDLMAGGFENAYVYYFGDKNDGSMKTGRQNITLDGDDLTFTFEKSGSKKGRGIDGVDDKKVYMGGKLAKAASDEKYEIVVIYHDGKIEKYEALELIENKLGMSPGTPVKDEADYYKDGVDGAFLVKLEDKLGNGAGTTDPMIKDYKVVNTSGSIIKSKSKCKNGDDIIFNLSNEKITRIYVED